jgi:hypothetical protein
LGQFSGVGQGSFKQKYPANNAPVAKSGFLQPPGEQSSLRLKYGDDDAAGNAPFIWYENAAFSLPKASRAAPKSLKSSRRNRSRPALP